VVDVEVDVEVLVEEAVLVEEEVEVEVLVDVLVDVLVTGVVVVTSSSSSSSSSSSLAYAPTPCTFTLPRMQVGLAPDPSATRRSASWLPLSTASVKLEVKPSPLQKEGKGGRREGGQEDRKDRKDGARVTCV
jgi:hypothetical protein